jgi:hypothetical protein
MEDKVHDVIDALANADPLKRGSPQTLCAGYVSRESCQRTRFNTGTSRTLSSSRFEMDKRTGV